MEDWKPITRVTREPILEDNVFRSKIKVKVTGPINAHTVNAQYLPNGKAYEVQTWYTDGARRPVSVQCQRSRSQGYVMRLTGVDR